MKYKCKRGLATLLAVLLLGSALPPGALATDTGTGSSAVAPSELLIITLQILFVIGSVIFFTGLRKMLFF